MANILGRWIEERLGILIQNFHDSFADITKDGHLLCQLLKSYGIITQKDLDLIETSQNINKCLNNFYLIRYWLNQLGVGITENETSEIINANGIASMNLFYKVYLALHDKNRMDFAVRNILNENGLSHDGKFHVDKVKERKAQTCLQSKPNAVLNENFDIINWHRDHLEMLINKRKQIREDYNHVIKNREKRNSITSNKLDVASNKDLNINGADNNNVSVESINLTFQQLEAEKKRINDLQQNPPKRMESRKILKNLKNKHKSIQTASVLKREFHRKILWNIWQKLKDEERQHIDEITLDNLFAQSYYEKQMLRKLEEVKHHKQTIMETKQIMADKINKAREQEFIDKLFGFDSEGKTEEIQYYFEKDRTLALHKKIYEEKLRLRSQRHHTMCNEIMNQLCDYAFRKSEYISYFGEEPKRIIINSWKQIFIAGLPLIDTEVPSEIIVQDNDDVESIIQLEIERQDKIDQLDFKNYIEFTFPWDLETINISEETLYEMKCGLNIIGFIIHQLLSTKYPLPSNPPSSNLPDVEVAVCITGFYEHACISILKKMFQKNQFEVFEIQEAINYCIAAYKDEMTRDSMESFEPVEQKPKAAKKIKKGMKSRGMQSQKGMETVSSIQIAPEKLDKKVQTPKYFGMDEILTSKEAELGKIAEEELAKGQALTDFLLIAMLVQYLHSKRNMKGSIK